jgi:hypothetical protein
MAAQAVEEIYRCTPRQAKAAVIDCIQAGLVPFLQSSPGMGKSSIMRQICDLFNLCLIDHRLSTSAPEDLSGLPNFINGVASFVPFDIFPTEDTPLPINPRTGQPYDGWMLFLDEANSATKLVQAACYKLVLDRMVGQKKIHPRCVITMAGNLSTDRALVNILSTAMQSRVIHIEMVVDFREWLEDVAIPEDYDERIIAYFSHGPDKLMDFKPDHQEKTFTCPRTVEFLNKLVKGKVFNHVDRNGEMVYEMEEKIPLYAGTLTSGVAIDFVQFTKVHHTITTVDEVVRDPANAKIPTDSPAKWMTISHLSKFIDKNNVAPLSQYANRMPIEFRVLFFRTMMSQHPSLRQHPAFAKAMVDLSQYLNS